MLFCHRSIECMMLCPWNLLQGGTLWFQNLTEFPHGLLGPIFPIVIAALHSSNVEISFSKSSLGKQEGTHGLSAKMSCEQFCLVLQEIFGCLDATFIFYWLLYSLALEKSEEIDNPEKQLDSPAKQRKISVKYLTLEKLVALSVKHLSKGQKERAFSFLQLVLDEDPDYINALIVMGQTQLQKGLLAEAIEYVLLCWKEHKRQLFISANPTEVENIDLLIVASQRAGVAYIRQGKMAEGIVHLERIANLEEPEEKSSKAHYYDGLVLLSRSQG
ncbi:hypothetical protein Pint_21311 [Pistacia integerrima]|uniref:Uncharacterized protein n=1 Tax=Pistacia integerrima TaxID=434235 RepID=A0ACC0XBR9_9ROSI|nr:hypothetical protein Pint_21311 [Pistacia integerrima]